MSIKVTFDSSSIKRVEEQTRQAFNKVIANRNLLNEVGKTLTDDIKFQTRKGFSIKDNRSFKPLSDKKHPFLFGIYGNLETSQTTLRPRKTKSGQRQEFRRVSQAKAEQEVDGLSYIDIRDAISRSTQTHPTFKPKRSNLTITGQLLDSLKWRIVKAGVIETLFQGTRTPYKIKSAKRGIREIGKPISNEKLAEYVQKDRPFVGVRDQVTARIKLKVIEYLRRSSRVLNLFR